MPGSAGSKLSFAEAGPRGSRLTAAAAALRAYSSESGELVWARRLAGPVCRPPVFANEPHLVEVGEPETSRWVKLDPMSPAPRETKATVRVNLSDVKRSDGRGD